MKKVRAAEVATTWTQMTNGVADVSTTGLGTVALIASIYTDEKLDIRKPEDFQLRRAINTDILDAKHLASSVLQCLIDQVR